MLDHIDVSVWVEILSVRELFGKRSSSENVFHDLNVPVLKLSDIKECLDSFNKLLFAELTNNFISSWDSKIN